MLKSFYTQFSPDVCRVCLDDESNVMTPLFDVTVTEAKNITYGDMLNQCSTVQAIDGDTLPAYICTACREALNNAYKFKQLAEVSDNILRHNESKSKIVFKNLDELKLKIEDKSIIENVPHHEVEQDLSKIVKKGGAIGNTVIQKVKKEIPIEYDEMDEDYLDDDDYVPESPPRKKRKKTTSKQHKLPKKSQSAKAMNVIATIKDLDSDAHPISYKYCTLKTPIPIKLSEEFKNEKLPLPRKPKLSRQQASRERAEIKLKRLISRPKLEPREKVKHVCNICGLQTYGLKAHLLTHLDQKPFKCEHCSKSFAQKGNYLMHVKKHTGVKDQVCEICGAAFYLPKSVRRHRMIHTKERSFGCHLCPKKFYVRCDLNRHLKVHSGYKPFKCDTCSVMFNAKHQLEAHIRIHTGEKPYSCEICNVAFTYKVNLNNHVFKIHGVNLKFKSIYKITPDILTELFQQNVESSQNKKSFPPAE